MPSQGPQPNPSAQGLDVRALTEPVDPQRLDAFITDSKLTDKPWKVMTTGLQRPGVGELISQLMPVVIPTVGVLAIVVAGGRSLAAAVWSFTFEAPFPLNLVIVGVLAMIGLGVAMAAARVIAIIRSFIVPRWWWEAAYRLVGFAGANRLRYGHDETSTLR